MTQQGGDRAYPTGDAITVKNDSGSSMNPGEWVDVTGHDGDHPKVKKSDSTNQPTLLGVVKADAGGADDGELTAAQMRGAVWARVNSSVVAGDELGAGSTEGVAVSGGSSGHYALDDAQELVSGSGDYFAPVLLD